ncbi:hypothetical protein NDK43_13875 [Neobacillus pocheonensis]|uniref:Uncharacterized protein n=1 Tax=Neobacillus pocheonensis TaxID=363869 RepID=A0ABT0WB80_9BACI|nr:hypothetical protein [Neobacillus pocheonensis]
MSEHYKYTPPGVQKGICGQGVSPAATFFSQKFPKMKNGKKKPSLLFLKVNFRVCDGLDLLAYTLMLRLFLPNVNKHEMKIAQSSDPTAYMNFNKTILKPYPIKDSLNLLDPVTIEKLKLNNSDKKVCMWGAKPRQ